MRLLPLVLLLAGCAPVPMTDLVCDFYVNGTVIQCISFTYGADDADVLLGCPDTDVTDARRGPCAPGTSRCVYTHEDAQTVTHSYVSLDEASRSCMLTDGCFEVP